MVQMWCLIRALLSYARLRVYVCCVLLNVYGVCVVMLLSVTVIVCVCVVCV